jgi:hypothetical protein
MWFAGLDTTLQALLVAEYRLAHETKEQRQTRQKRANKATIDERLTALRNKEAHYGS